MNDVNDIMRKLEAKKKQAKKSGLKRFAHPQNHGRFYITTDEALIRDPEYRKVMAGTRTTYDWIRTNIVRGEMNHPIAQWIRKHYFDERRLLAYSASYRQLAKDLFRAVGTVKGDLKRLEEAKYILTEPMPKPKGNKRPQFVYILGNWEPGLNDFYDVSKREFYFIDNKWRKIDTTDVEKLIRH